MGSESTAARDDAFTLMSISILAYVLGDILHEGVGHGLTAWLSGARHLTMSTVALNADIDTRLISAGGTIVNLLAGATFWLILRNASRFKPATRYFFVLAMAGNLFSGTGYFLFSGVLNFGDWADVIRGFQAHWIWQLGLVVIGVPAYYVAMSLVAAEIKAFQSKTNRSRLRRLCWTPYFAEGILSALAGALNPMGLFYVIASALPSTMGANTGLFVLPFSMHARDLPDEPSVGSIKRSLAWIAAGAIAALLFILVLGRGLTWSR